MELNFLEQFLPFFLNYKNEFCSSSKWAPYTFLKDVKVPEFWFLILYMQNISIWDMRAKYSTDSKLP